MGLQRILANLQGMEDLTGTHQALPHRPQQNLPTKGQTVGKTLRKTMKTWYTGVIQAVVS